MPIVKVGDQRIKFPDDMSQEDIQRVLQERFPSAQQPAASEEPQRSSGIGSALQGIGQGATLSQADEIAAGARAVAERYLNPFFYAVGQKFGGGAGADQSFTDLYQQFQEDWYGGDIGERYQEALASQREAYQAAREEDPWTTGIAEFGGGMLTGGTGLAKTALATAGAKAVPRTLALAGTGAATGAAVGYGAGTGDPIAAQLLETGEDVGAELSEAAESAITGAKYGAALGAATPIAGKLAQGLKNLTGKAASQVLSMVSPTARQAKLTEKARQQIMESLQSDIDSGYITLESAKKELADIPGMTPAALGPGMRARAAQVAADHTEGARLMERFVTDQAKGRWKRLHPELTKAMGIDDEYSAMMRELTRTKKAAAEANYTIAREIPVRVTPELKNMLENPGIKAAVKEANKVRALENLSPIADDIPVGSQMRTEDMDNILREINILTRRAFKKGKGAGKGKALADLRDDFQEKLYGANDYLREARRAWAHDSANEEALEMGRKMFGKEHDITADMIRDLKTESEQMFFKMGQLRGLSERIRGKGYKQDLDNLWSNPKFRTSMRVAFGDKTSFDNFIRYAEDEQKLFDLYKEVAGATAAKRMMRDGMMERVTSAVGYAGALQSGGQVQPGALANIARRAHQAIAPPGRFTPSEQAISRYQQELLTGQGPKALEAITTPLSAQAYMPSLSALPALPGRVTNALEPLQGPLTPRVMGGLLQTGAGQ